MTSDPGYAHIQCDTCNGVHHMQTPGREPGQTTLETLNQLLANQGWEIYQLADETTRHRCVACVRLRQGLALAEARYARLSTLFQDYQEKDV